MPDSLIYAGPKGSAVGYRKLDMPPDTLSSAEDEDKGLAARLHAWRAVHCPDTYLLVRCNKVRRGIPIKSAPADVV